MTKQNAKAKVSKVEAVKEANVLAPQVAGSIEVSKEALEKANPAPVKKVAKKAEATVAPAPKAEVAEEVKPTEKMVKTPAKPAPKAKKPVENAEKPVEKVEAPTEKADKKAVVKKALEAKDKAEAKKAEALSKAKETAQETTAPKATKKGAKVAPKADKTKVVKPAEYKPWFPDTFKVGNQVFTKLNKAYTYKELVDLYFSGTDLYFVSHWTKQDIKEYRYAQNHDVEKPKGGVFPNDLDVSLLGMVVEIVERFFVSSIYTGACTEYSNKYKVFNKDIWEHDGKEEACRVNNDLPYEIYTCVVVEEEKAEKKAE